MHNYLPWTGFDTVRLLSPQNKGVLLITDTFTGAGRHVVCTTMKQTNVRYTRLGMFTGTRYIKKMQRLRESSSKLRVNIACSPLATRDRKSRFVAPYPSSGSTESLG
jgi:hypothetical protein